MESVREVALQKPEVSCHACCKRLESSFLTICFTPTLQCMYTNTSQMHVSMNMQFMNHISEIKRQAQMLYKVIHCAVRVSATSGLAYLLHCILCVLSSKFKSSKFITTRMKGGALQVNKYFLLRSSKAFPKFNKFEVRGGEFLKWWGLGDGVCTCAFRER